MKVLLTSGGTKAKIDDVRNVGNMSSGTFGNHICHALLEAGEEVVFLYAKGSKCPHEVRVNMCVNGSIGIHESLAEDLNFFDKHRHLYTPVVYEDFQDYAKKLKELLEDKPEVVILAAAVSDYIPEKSDGKISSELSILDIHMVKAPKLIKLVKQISPNSFLVGFKLLVGSTQEQLIAAMEKQVESTKADMVVGNDLMDIKANQHSLTIYTSGNNTVLYHSNMSGAKLAKVLSDSIINRVEDAKATQIIPVTPYVQQKVNFFVPYDWAMAVGDEMFEYLGFKHDERNYGDILEAIKKVHDNNLLVMTKIGNDCIILFVDTPRGGFRQR
jgi:phosphopantothenate---cysteine ligase (CTP)